MFFKDRGSSSDVADTIENDSLQVFSDYSDEESTDIQMDKYGDVKVFQNGRLVDDGDIDGKTGIPH